MAIAIAIAGVLTGLWLIVCGGAFPVRNNIPDKPDLLSLWENLDYQAVYDSCLMALSESPLDPFFLVYLGFSGYYSGLSIIDGEAKLQRIDSAAFALRKALVVGVGKLDPQVKYVLGKCYFQKGEAYLREAIRFLSEALDEGYIQDDSYQYLGMAHEGLGEHLQAADMFEKALSTQSSDLVLLASAQALAAAGNTSEAERRLRMVAERTGDIVLRQKSRFLLGDIARERGDWDGAEAIYRAVLEDDQGSSDAHYYLGILYQAKGDMIRARASWRKAIAIEPMHTLSRQKLAEKF